VSQAAAPTEDDSNSEMAFFKGSSKLVWMGEICFLGKGVTLAHLGTPRHSMAGAWFYSRKIAPVKAWGEHQPAPQPK